MLPDIFFTSVFERMSSGMHILAWLAHYGCTALHCPECFLLDHLWKTEKIDVIYAFAVVGSYWVLFTILL